MTLSGLPSAAIDRQLAALALAGTIIANTLLKLFVAGAYARSRSGGALWAFAASTVVIALTVGIGLAKRFGLFERGGAGSQVRTRLHPPIPCFTLIYREFSAPARPRTDLRNPDFCRFAPARGIIFPQHEQGMLDPSRETVLPSSESSGLANGSFRPKADIGRASQGGALATLKLLSLRSDPTISGA